MSRRARALYLGMTTDSVPSTLPTKVYRLSLLVFLGGKVFKYDHHKSNTLGSIDDGDQNHGTLQNTGEKYAGFHTGEGGS